MKVVDGQATLDGGLTFPALMATPLRYDETDPARGHRAYVFDLYGGTPAMRREVALFMIERWRTWAGIPLEGPDVVAPSHAIDIDEAMTSIIAKQSEEGEVT